MSRFDNIQARGLDGRALRRKGTAMTRTPLLIALAAAAALAGCTKENHTIVAGGPDELGSLGGRLLEKGADITVPRLRELHDEERPTITDRQLA